MVVKKRKSATEKSKRRERALYARQADESGDENVRVRKKNSTLRIWRVVREGIGYRAGWIGIECPRCGGKAVVKERSWVMIAKDYLGRSCTHCFNVSWIPLDLLPKGDDRRYDYERLERKNGKKHRRRRR